MNNVVVNRRPVISVYKNSLVGKMVGKMLVIPEAVVLHEILVEQLVDECCRRGSRTREVHKARLQRFLWEGVHASQRGGEKRENCKRL